MKVLSQQRGPNCLLFLALLVLGVPAQSVAAPAAPIPIVLEQPDGTHVDARRVGDAWCNRLETLDGRPLIQTADGWWRESERESRGGNIRASGAGTVQPLAPGSRDMEAPCSPSPWRTPAASSASRTGVGTFQVLMILVSFTDQPPTYPASTFASLLDVDLVDYYAAASFGAAAIVPARESYDVPWDGVVGWLPLGIPHPDTANLIGLRNQRLTRAAIRAADPYVDYAAYDRNGDGVVDSDELAVVVVAAGYDCAYATMHPSVWAHSWWLHAVDPPEVDGVVVGGYHGNEGGYAQIGEIHARSDADAHAATVGVLAHELGHLVFRLPDLYDIDQSSNGVGPFCLMGFGNWGKTSQDQWIGSTPVLTSAYIRCRLEWSVARSASGTVAVRAAGSPLAGADDTVWMAETSDPAEYFLVENREPFGYDEGLTRFIGASFGGIAIWHVNENAMLNFIDVRRLSDLEEADGTADAATATALWYDGNPESQGVFDARSDPSSDLFAHRPSGVRIVGFSAPAETMTVTVETSGE